MIAALKKGVVLLGFMVLGVSNAASSQSITKVMVSTKPLHSLVQNVLGDVAKATLLIKGQASPHDYVLKPSQMRQLNQAQLVVYFDDELESSLFSAMKALGSRSNILKISSLSTLRRWSVRHNSEVGSNEPLTGEPLDKHLWLDIKNAEAIIWAIEAVLSRLDSGHVAVFRLNAEKAVARLRLLDGALAAQLKSVQEQPFMVMHDASQYFERGYGLNNVGTILSESHLAPSISRIRAAKMSLQNQAVVCLFQPVASSQRLAETIIEGSQTKLITIDPAGSLIKAGEQQYFEMMTVLGNQFLKCLSSVQK